MPSTDPEQTVNSFEKAEKDAKLAAKVRDADVVILVKKETNDDGAVVGAGALAWSNEFGRSLPYEIEASFTGEEPDDPDGFFRQVMVKAGWNRKDWRKLDRSGLRDTKEASHA